MWVVDVWFHTFLTSGLEGCEWFASRAGDLPAGKNTGTQLRATNLQKAEFY
jgi:hypothetical protein